MDGTFEERLAEIQSKMILACMDYADNRAECVYIYASREGRSTSAQFFFKINGQVVKKHKLGEGYDVSSEHQSVCLDALTAYIHEVEDVCKECGKDMPTEMKIIYNAANDKTDITYRYDLVYSNKKNKSDYDVMEEWFEKMQKA